MPRLTATEARRRHPLVRRRAGQDRFRERRGDSAETEDIRGTYEEGASATEVDVWGAGWW